MKRKHEQQYKKEKRNDKKIKGKRNLLIIKTDKRFPIRCGSYTCDQTDIGSDQKKDCEAIIIPDKENGQYKKNLNKSREMNDEKNPEKPNINKSESSEAVTYSTCLLYTSRCV